jgi:hypothetical protein
VHSAGANPTIVSYNASAVKIYNAKSSPGRSGKIASKNAISYYSVSVVVVNSKVPNYVTTVKLYSVTR